MFQGSWTKLATRGIIFAIFVVGLQSISLAENWLEGVVDQPRMATFDQQNKSTCFALSLSPGLENSESPSDIVVFVDTSASQTGIFKKDSIRVVKRLLEKLNTEDRVKLVAVDLDPIPLTREFVRPDSAEMLVALENLQGRVSLGSTDMALMLDTAPAQFKGSKRSKNVIYIGDGISRAGLLTSKRFSKALAGLVKNKIPVSSFAIGPERNMELLAALANNTGGNFFVDTDDDSSVENGAQQLSQTVHASVFWPTQVNVPLKEFYPQQLPPMRADRDTVLVGTLENRSSVKVNVSGTVNGVEKKLEWEITPEVSNVDFAFLPKLLRIARRDGGMTLPTVGSAGLREIASTIDADSEQLVTLAVQAEATGNSIRARQLAEAALTTNPNNERAALLSAKYKVQEDDPFGNGDAPKQEDDPFGGAPPQQEQKADAPKELEAPAEAKDDVAVPAQPAVQNQQQEEIVEATDDSLRMIAPQEVPQDEVDRLLQQNRGESNEALNQELDFIRVRTERLTRQIEYELSQAQRELAVAPDNGIERLKAMIDILDQSTDIDPSRRQDLRSRLESALMNSRREKFVFDTNQAAAQRRLAESREFRKRVQEMERKEDRIARLINRFDTLLQEEEFDEAQQTTSEAFSVDPTRPETTLADESSRMIRANAILRKFIRRRELMTMDNLLGVDEAAIPLSYNQPVVYPDPEVWHAKKARRIKFKDVRLAGNPTDEKILRKLDNEIVDWDFQDEEFTVFRDKMREDYGINIVLDQSAKEDGLPEDDTFNFQVRGIRMKNALRLMLKEKNSTYIVKDEVLKIISKDVANEPENFVTNIYNVADLIAPRQNFGGGGFGGGGFGGGGGGFGGGGFGGGGFGGGGRGGFGGGGGGLGGGGVFCVTDSLEDEKETAKPQKKRSARVLKLADGETWDTFFKVENNFPAPADVRLTVRRTMKKKEFKEVIEIVNAAIRNNQSQPWMFEALMVAMTAENFPQSEIERVLMSTVDLSDKEADAMIAAQFMVRNGMEKRGIRLLRDISESNPTRPEPFVLALEAAEKIKDHEGLMWSTVGILSQAWPKHRQVVRRAVLASKALQQDLAKSGKNEMLREYAKQVEEALYRDCIVKIAWTGDGDLDSYIQEPGGTVCSRYNPRTTAGGVLMGDEFTNSEKQGETAEYYVLPKGFAGDYQIAIKKVWGKIAGNKATVTIYTNFRHIRKTSGVSSNKSNLRKMAI